MRRLALAVSIALAAAASASAGGPANSPWPQAYANAQHTSSTTFTGAARPRMKWIVAADANLQAGSGVTIGADGSIYAVTQSSMITWTPAGVERWRALLTNNGPTAYGPGHQAALTNDGQVLISTNLAGFGSYSAMSLNPVNGSVVTGGMPLCASFGADQGSPLLSYSGTAYYLTGDNLGGSGGTYCATAVRTNGSSYWENIGYASYPGPTGPGALSTDGSTFYFLTNGDLYAEHSWNGGLSWTALGISGKNLSAGGNGNVYVVTGSGLRAYGPTGASLWTYSLSNVSSFPPAVSGNTVVITTVTPGAMIPYSMNLLAITDNGGSASLAWRVDLLNLLQEAQQCSMACTTDYLVGPPVIAGSLVYVAISNSETGPTAANKFIVALNLSDGSLKWIVPVPAYTFTGGAFQSVLGQVIPDASQLYYYDTGNLLAFENSGAASFALSVSSQTLAPGQVSTFTVTIKDGSNNPVSGVGVVFDVLRSSASLAPLGAVAYTNSLGIATMTFSSSSFNSSVLDSTAVVRTQCLDFPPVDTPIHLEGEAIDHFYVSVPTYTPIGVPFQMNVFARNKYDHGLPSFPGTGAPVTVSLSPYLAGTGGTVAGTGSLGTTSVGINNGTGTVTSETYNKIEAIDIKATETSPLTIVGVSSDIAVTGPDHFVVTIPTGIPAGANFPVTITAMAGGQQVAGYTNTLSLSPVVWNSTGTSGSGTLSVTNVNMGASGQVTITNETYSTGQGIRLAVADTSLGITSYSSSMTVTQPSLTIDHYGFQLPSQVSVGVPFRFEIDALNASSAPVTYTLDRAVNIQAFIAGTGFGVSGSGSLGNSNMTVVAGSTYAIVTAQTYNKIETLQLKATDPDGRVGFSTFTLTVSGPNHFDVVMPTATQAGQNFQMTVIARDAGNNQVLGYNGTVSLAAVQAATVTLSGGGVLGVTNLNVSGGQVTTAFQSYTKTEGIRVRIADSGIGVTSYSSSMTVTAGPPAQLSILANPQSTVAGVASVLTSTVLDLYNNPVAGSTVTFSLLTGSGTVSTAITGLPSAVTSTSAVAGVTGSAQAFFASTNTTSAQADVLRASINGLTADTTIYNAVLIGPAGGTIVNFGDPASKAVVPPNAYGFNVRLALNENAELAASDVALATAAMAKSPNTFVSTFTAKISAVLDSNPNVSAGGASQLVTVQFPFNADTSSNVQVGSYRGSSLRPSSLLVPFSVMRVFKLNKATNVFEMILDGTNLPNIGSRAVAAQVSDPNGIYALGAPPFTAVASGSSATITTSLASGATATVNVPFGAFAVPVVVQVGIPSLGSVPAISGAGVKGTGVTISVSAGGVQPVGSVGVTIGYAPGDIAGLNPNNLRLARYDPATGWMVLDSQVDTVGRTVTGQTNHFSLFQIVAVSPQNDVSQGFAFPNPFRPSQGHTTIGFANLPASCHVKVFSVSGRLLKELDADTTGRVTGWDGSDSNGRPLPSGVYIAVFVNGSDKRTFKFAVQR